MQELWLDGGRQGLEQSMGGLTQRWPHRQGFVDQFEHAGEKGRVS
jgi:hypothetical protein